MQTLVWIDIRFATVGRDEIPYDPSTARSDLIDDVIPALLRMACGRLTVVNTCKTLHSLLQFAWGILFQMPRLATIVLYIYICINVHRNSVYIYTHIHTYLHMCCLFALVYRHFPACDIASFGLGKSSKFLSGRSGLWIRNSARALSIMNKRLCLPLVHAP